MAKRKNRRSFGKRERKPRRKRTAEKETATNNKPIICDKKVLLRDISFSYSNMPKNGQGGSVAVAMASGIFRGIKSLPLAVSPRICLPRNLQPLNACSVLIDHKFLNQFFMIQGLFVNSINRLRSTLR